MTCRSCGSSDSISADQRQERTLDDDRLDVGVLEDVAQLVGDVPVVDVDRDEPRLERAEERLDPLGAVPAVDRHLGAGFETQTEQVVRDAVRALVELRERPARRPATSASRSGTVSTTISRRSARLNVGRRPVAVTRRSGC